MLKPPNPIMESINGDRYQLTEDFPVKFGYWMREYQFEIPKGFTTDIASVPWWFRSVCDRASLGIIAPICHDFICDKSGRITNIQGDELQVGWFEANLLFLILMRLDGVHWLRALLAFLAVTIGSPKW
jgi:hypothetical protein